MEIKREYMNDVMSRAAKIDNYRMIETVPKSHYIVILMLNTIKLG